MPNGKLKLCVVSTFDAAQEAEARRLGRKVPDLRPHPAARLLMRLHKNDLVAMGQGEARRILLVVNLDPGRLVFADHFETGNIRERHRNPDDRFRYVMLSATGMQREGVRPVSVDPAGVVRDRGPIL
jgi:CRISPR-associated endonuclease Csn1